MILLSALWVGLSGASAFANPKTLDRLEATVNSSTILRSDVEHFRRLIGLRAQLDRIFLGTPLARKGAAASDPEIINFLIEERLICSAFPTSDQDVEQTISQIVTNNHSDRNALKAALQSQGYSYDDYFELMRAGKCKNSLIESEIRPKVSISDEDVRNHMENIAPRPGQKGPAHTQHIQLLYISPKSYKTPALAHKVAQEAYAAIRGGEDFTAVAQRMSDGPNAAEGGDLGNIPDSQLQPLIRQQVSKLNPGEISEPFGNPKDGYTIVRLIERTVEDSPESSAAKDRVREELAAAEYQRQLQLWLERQKQKAFIHRAGEPPSAALPKV